MNTTGDDEQTQGAEMAGRPQTQAKRIRELEERFLDFESSFRAVVPGMYLDRPDSDDQLNVAWNETVRCIAFTSHQLTELGDLLRARAGITEPGPSNNGKEDRDNPPEVCQRKGHFADMDDLIEELRDKEATPLENILWVAKWIDVARENPARIKDLDPPSAAALTMMKCYAKDERSWKEFYKDVYNKTVLTKSQMEHDVDMTEDDRSVDEIEKLFLEGLAKEAA